jgi:hypothetical protein
VLHGRDYKKLFGKCSHHLQGCNAVPWQSAFAALACEILTRVLGQNRVDEAGVGDDDKISEEHLERR